MTPRRDQSGTDDGDGLDDAATDADRAARARRRNRLLVYPTEYRPFVPFRVTGKLPAPLTVRLLSRPAGGRVAEIPDPSEYTGYVIRMRPTPPGTPTFVYTRGTLRVRRRYRMLADAQVFSPELNLLAVTAVPLRRDQTASR